MVTKKDVISFILPALMEPHLRSFVILLHQLPFLCVNQVSTVRQFVPAIPH